MEPAGLFESADGGMQFSHVSGLHDHPSKESWTPGAGGLILHNIVRHPTDPNQTWIAISAAGVFYTSDGGKSWEARNTGTRCDFFPEDMRFPGMAECLRDNRPAIREHINIFVRGACGPYNQLETWGDGLHFDSYFRRISPKGNLI